MNGCIQTNGDLTKFCLANDLTDTVDLLHPTQAQDPTYLYREKRSNYMFISPSLSAMAVKVGHNQFDQHVVSDHKGVYLQFFIRDLFNNKNTTRDTTLISASEWEEGTLSNDIKIN